MIGAILIFGIIFFLIFLAYSYYHTIASNPFLVSTWRYIVLALAFISIAFPTIYHYYTDADGDSSKKTLMDAMIEKHSRGGRKNEF